MSENLYVIILFFVLVFRKNDIQIETDQKNIWNENICT